MRHLVLATAAAAAIVAAGWLPSPAVAADLFTPEADYAPPQYAAPPPYVPPRVVAPAPPPYVPPRVVAPAPPPYYAPPAYVPQRPARYCDPQWQCGAYGCGWRRVCSGEVYSRPYRGYAPPVWDGYGPGPGQY